MPPRNVGTLSRADLLELRTISPLKLGLDTVRQSLENDQAIYNRLLQEMLDPFVAVTQDVRRRYGVGSTIRGGRVDEFGRMHTQKAITGSEVNFPLDARQYAVGWTAAFFRDKSVADMMTTQIAIQDGHILDVLADLKSAMYLSQDYTFNDYRDTTLDLAVKRFVNADGAPIPTGPNGVTFDGSTHTHYLAVNGLDNTSAKALVRTVLEHYAVGPIQVFINQADESAWRGLTDFHACPDPRLTVPTSAAQPRQTVDIFDIGDRAIGVFDAAEVVVKPWAIANYALCLSQAPGIDKPVAMRTRAGSNVAGIDLKTVATNVLYPLQADYMESEYGFGVWNRLAGAVLYSGGGVYTDPTIT